MKLITSLKNGSKIVTNLNNAVFIGKGRTKITPKELKEKLDTTARAIGGLEYINHKIQR